MNIDWDGNGLPPVGVTCERRFDDLEDSSWQRMTVIAYGKRKVFYSDKNGDEWGHFFTELEFRPVETKRLHEIRNACTAVNSKIKDYNVSLECSAAIRATVEAMIDAGYSKFEIVEEDV